MGKDYYKTLGVEKNASKEDIKKAFRKLAHEHHPDKNKGNDAAAQKFKEASEAYSTLSDDAKRQQYDTFGSAGPAGAGQGGYGAGGPFGGFDFSGFARQAGAQGGFGGQGGNGQGFEFDLGDIFGEFFGGGARRARKGRNIQVDIQITFSESIFGLEREVSNGKDRFSVKIPPGMESGQGLRIPNRGEMGEGGQGDLIVRVWVEEHASIRREGFNLVGEISVKLTTALAGGTVNVDTLDGQIELKIPSGTNHAEVLRVKGKGVPMTERGKDGKRGDLLIVIRVEMPRKISKNAAHLIEELKKEGL